MIHSSKKWIDYHILLHKHQEKMYHNSLRCCPYCGCFDKYVPTPPGYNQLWWAEISIYDDLHSNLANLLLTCSNNVLSNTSRNVLSIMCIRRSSELSASIVDRRAVINEHVSHDILFNFNFAIARRVARMRSHPIARGAALCTLTRHKYICSDFMYINFWRKRVWSPG